jgi:hypothetical protein
MKSIKRNTVRKARKARHWLGSCILSRSAVILKWDLWGAKLRLWFIGPTSLLIGLFPTNPLMRRHFSTVEKLVDPTKVDWVSGA